ncbi:YeaH/YhbH family protein [Patescibacteria group bacterium]
MKRFTIVDQRKGPRGKNLPNQERFKGRLKASIKKSVKKRFNKKGIKDFIGSENEKLTVLGDGVDEPTFVYQVGGSKEEVLPGNKDFRQGDRVKKSGSSDRSCGSPDGGGEDGFEFELSNEEFLNIVFEGLELPDMVKKALFDSGDFKWQRAGFSPQGAPNTLDLKKTIRKATARKAAFSRRKKKKKLKSLEEELASIERDLSNLEEGSLKKAEERIVEIKEQIETLKGRLKSIRFIDEHDLRFRQREKVPVPTSKAVMFRLMDVSASMGESEKRIAKLFFWLLYLFLDKNYDKVEIVNIRHHSAAKEVDDEEFFHSRETGGTLVSTGLRKVVEIIEERFPVLEWNIYVSQATDGDNWLSDLDLTYSILEDEILSIVQYYTYVEINQSGRSDLWSGLEGLKEKFNNLAIGRLVDEKDILPIFREFFKKSGVLK